MSCNCKVGQQIDYLHQKYGEDLPKNKKTNIRGSVMAHIENAVIYILLLPAIPFFLIYAVFKSFSGEAIHIDKMFRKAWVKQQSHIG